METNTLGNSRMTKPTDEASLPMPVEKPKKAYGNSVN